MWYALCSYICAFEIRAQEYNITENSKGKIKYDGWRKTKKWKIYKYITIHNDKPKPGKKINVKDKIENIQKASLLPHCCFTSI